MTEAEVAAFIRANLPLTPVPGIPEIELHTAGPSSRLSRLLADADAAPYWAYPWSGGAALARYLLDHPATIRSRRVLDLGAGGGIVAIAAALSGARKVTAAEIDATGCIALGLNAAANRVVVAIVNADLTVGPVPEADLILAGDVFYAPDVAARVTAFLERCRAAGIDVLVGDPGRADLPHPQLALLAEYEVTEVGATRGATTTPTAVYRFGAG